jgi:hypothetical protein
MLQKVPITFKQAKNMLSSFLVVQVQEIFAVPRKPAHWKIVQASASGTTLVRWQQEGLSNSHRNSLRSGNGTLGFQILRLH